MKAITEVGNGSDCEPWQLTTGLIPVCDELEALEFLTPHEFKEIP